LCCPDSGATAANAASLIATILGVSHAMVLRLRPGGDGLLLQGAVGWEPDLVGRARFSTDKNALLGFAFASSEPVVIEDLRTESRFGIPALVAERALVSGVCARIPCEYEPFGVVAVFSSEPRIFSQDELSCIRVIAGLLAVSAGCMRTREVRRDDQEKITQAKNEWEATVDALPHFICLLDEQKRIVRANRSLGQWVPASAGDIRGYTLHALLHPDCKDADCYMRVLCDDTWAEVLNGQPREFRVEDKVLERHLEIQIRPTARRERSGQTQTSRAVVVFQDVTRIRQAEDVLRTSNDHLESLVRARTAELVRANEQLKREIVEREHIEAKLRRSENEMRLLSMQLLTAQEMERKRIASELHDGIGQSLTAIKFSMENAISLWAPKKDDRDLKLIRSVIPKMQGAIDEVRRISMDLRPSTLDDLGILPTLAWFCREFRTIYNHVQLDTHIDIAEDQVPEPLKTVIYRIVQEAMNNVAKHAKAQRAQIGLRNADSIIELIVQDDGGGFDMDSLTKRSGLDKGSGLGSMRERAESSGGTFEIMSDRKVGTTIQVSWPGLQ
jgi:signal transduction histidine kinase